MSAMPFRHDAGRKSIADLNELYEDDCVSEERVSVERVSVERVTKFV